MMLLNRPTVLVQGITGQHGALHTASMLQYGTNIVAGTSLNTETPTVSGVPVFATVDAAKEQFPALNTSVIFVPAQYCKDAILEAILAGITYIVCITEGIPIHDMIDIKNIASEQNVTIVGPNSPGVALPHLKTKLGIIPASVLSTGTTALISTSGTLTYEVAASMAQHGIGQRVVIGIGGDPIKGTNLKACLQSLSEDRAITAIVLIGEIGGNDEYLAADYIETHRELLPPIFGYITGHYAPIGVQLGHAGAILKRPSESARAKSDRLAQAGVTMSETLPELIKKLLKN